MSFGVFDGIAALALIVHIEDSDLKIIFDNFSKIIKPSGVLFIAYVEGDGLNKKRSFVEIDGEKYNRAFYCHKPERIIEVAQKSKFNYYDEWFLDKQIRQWKFFVFQSN
jgi:2-polyprenyl-3-methyl-5-hydroxy-6-metoxy-1,4-benzoquinol methylase